MELISMLKMFNPLFAIFFDNFVFHSNISNFFNSFRTALIYASNNGYANVAQLLIEQKVTEINVKDIDISKWYLEFIWIILVRINVGCFWRPQRNCPNAPWAKWNWYQCQKCFLILIKICFYKFMFQNNIWRLFKLFKTALMLASEEGQTEIVKLISGYCK